MQNHRLQQKLFSIPYALSCDIILPLKSQILKKEQTLINLLSSILGYARNITTTWSKGGKSDILNVHCDPFLTKLAFLSFMLSTATIIPWTASPTKRSFLLLQRSYSAFTIHCTSVKERDFLLYIMLNSWKYFLCVLQVIFSIYF